MEIIFRFVPLLIDETISILKTQLVRGALGKVKGFFAKNRQKALSLFLGVFRLTLPLL